MKKKKLLAELQHNTSIMLKPSPVAGIGVFALTDIKKGQRNIFSSDKSKWVKISRKKVAKLPLHSRELIENFCLYDAENYFIPEYGFKMIELVIFLNHFD